jgi:ABC-type multidrug transport system fused ATPase/permease subunit
MLIADVLLCLLVFVSLCFVNIYIALLEIILFTPIVLFYHYKIAGKMQEAGRVDNRAKRDLWRITSETFRGFADVVVNRFLPYLQKSFDTGIRDVSRSKIRVERLKSLSSKSIEVAIMLMIVGFVAGFYFIGGGDRQFLPLIGIFAAASLKLLPSVRSILSLIGTMRNTGYTLEVLFKAETDAVSGNAPEVATGAEEPMTFHKFIEFRHVTFGFDPGEPILRDVSFRIQKGERVGISGPTGKGKSTLMYLLMGLYRPQTGSILIDGVPLGPENTEAWHRRIGYVSQDVFITEGTLAQNVTPYCEGDRLPIKDDRKRPKNDCGQSEEDQEQRRLADEQQLKGDQTQLEEDLGRLEDSLKTASLGDWLASLPKGIQTPIGEGGARLSGGERQRVGIARAHFKKAEILLMDEPTSALDPATEAGITGILLREFMNRDMTVVIISHRDSLLEQCDRIIDITEWSI